MIESIAHYFDLICRLIGYLFVFHCFLRHNRNGETPSNWELFLLILLLA
jgi:hypothetical protein